VEKIREATKSPAWIKQDQKLGSATVGEKKISVQQKTEASRTGSNCEVLHTHPFVNWGGRNLRAKEGIIVG